LFYFLFLEGNALVVLFLRFKRLRSCTWVTENHEHRNLLEFIGTWDLHGFYKEYIRYSGNVALCLRMVTADTT